MLKKLITSSSKNGLLHSFLRQLVLPVSYSSSSQPQSHHASSGTMCINLKQNADTLDMQFSSDHETERTQTLTYPYVWLRDNCQCSACYSNEAQCRMLNLRDININSKPKDVQVDSHSSTVYVTWDDDHRSQYDMEWLKKRRFTDENRKFRRAVFNKPAITWGSEMQGQVYKVEYDELLSCDKALYKWLVTLEQVGISIITKAPTRTGVLYDIGDRVAFLRRTNYGPTFQVQSKFNPSNAAYTGGTLGFHTDLAYYHYTPGMQMLHCIKQVESEGGDNIFADGFHVAKIMKKEYPVLYKILKDTTLDFFDIGTDHYKFHKFSRHSIIQEDEQGDVCKITYGSHSRDSYLPVSLDKVGLLYEAMYTMEELMNGDRCLIHHKMDDGEIACFHNFRVLHGRTSFSVTGGGERHLEGSYIDWDEMRSKRRVLEEEMGILDN